MKARIMIIITRSPKNWVVLIVSFPAPTSSSSVSSTMSVKLVLANVLPSFTRISMMFSPTWSLVGVQVKVPSPYILAPGMTVYISNVNGSPSGSDAVILYVKVSPTFVLWVGIGSMDGGRFIIN